MSDRNKILVIMTGGTICSSTDEKGQRFSSASKINIINDFKDGKAGWSPFSEVVEFDSEMPTDILSENMTVEKWNIILDCIRKVEAKKYNGIIILHGTDTLGFTAPLLSAVLSGYAIPVMLVSAQLPLDNDGTNGHANFKAAVELIMNGIKPNVYAVYQNMDGKMYLHLGSRLLQCKNFSDDFESDGMQLITETDNAKADGKDFETDTVYINKMGKLMPSVLCIAPHVGLDYSVFKLDEVKAVVHGTYHTESVCVDRSRGIGEITDSSILSFIGRCKEKNVDFFLAPCSAEAFKYESTGDALSRGAKPSGELTLKTAYVKALVGVSLGLSGGGLAKFITDSINYEK